MMDLIERLRAVEWEEADDCGRMPDDPTRECVFVDMRPDDFESLLAEAAAALEAAREDAERLDWLDSMNAKLNSHYGTTYRWKLVLSPNVVRLMSGAGGNGHAAAIDLHDSEAHGTFTCREAIDQARGKENGND